MEWTLEIVLGGLLVATIIQALRLERALGVLKRDRAELEALVVGFNASTKHAEAGIQRLVEVADGAGRQIERQIAAAASLKDDLILLSDRGDSLADRLDMLIRTVRPLTAAPASPDAAPDQPVPGPARSETERTLLQALRVAR